MIEQNFKMWKGGYEPIYNFVSGPKVKGHGW